MAKIEVEKILGASFFVLVALIIISVAFPGGDFSTEKLLQQSTTTKMLMFAFVGLIAWIGMTYLFRIGSVGMTRRLFFTIFVVVVIIYFVSTIMCNNLSICPLKGIMSISQTISQSIIP